MASLELELKSLLQAELQQGYFTAAYVESGRLDEKEPRLRLFQSQSGHVFDLASLTKALITGPLVHQILQAQNLDFQAPLKAWVSAGVKLPAQFLNLTSEEVLGHVSGLPAWWNFWINHLDDLKPTRPSALARMEEVLDRIPLGMEKKDVYSDVGYILLGYLLEKLGPLSPFVKLQEPFDYAPHLNLKVDAYVPTAYCKIRERQLQGEVHDENCASLGGISGHAGLFGSGEALSQFLRYLANHPQGVAYLEANEKARLDTSREGLLGFRRGNGISAAPFANGQSMGHLGFTGTAFWLEWSSKKYGIFLSNRVISGRVSSRMTDIRRKVFNFWTQALAELKIAIIGRGLAGLTLAFRMVEAGFRPVVFGKNRGPGNASRCAQGIVCNKGLIFAESPLFRAKLQSLKKLESWLSHIEKVSREPIPRNWQGIDEPYWSVEDFQKTVQRVYRNNFWGCYRAKNLPPTSWVKDFNKPLGYLHYPDDAWFDVDATMNALEKACENHGALFREEAVEELEPLLHMFDHTTVAAGSDSIHLIESLGIRVPKYFHVAGQSLTWHHLPQEKTQILVKGTLSLAVLPNRKILGSSSWKPDPHHAPNLFEDQNQLLHLAQESFGLPCPDTGDITSNWGTRIRFADRMPALGIWPDESLHQKLSILTGLYKNGLQLADLCAEQLLNELQGNPLNEFGEAFHINRFFRKSGRLIAGSPPRACPLSRK